MQGIMALYWVLVYEKHPEMGGMAQYAYPYGSKRPAEDCCCYLRHKGFVTVIYKDHNYEKGLGTTTKADYSDRSTWGHWE